MGTAAGVGVVLALVVAVLIWKKTWRKTAAVLAVFAGLCLSAMVVQYAGPLTAFSVGGVGVVTAGLIIGVLVWLHELRGHGHHVMRTPIIGFTVGVLAMMAGGAIGQFAHHTQTSVVNTVHTGTSSTVGGG
jgi:hypothetical protein